MNFEASVLDAALASLPSCVRCRARRIGCDQSLPSCQPCLAAGTECELYDYILEAKFPRSYLLALHQRLQTLERLSASVPPPPAVAEAAPPQPPAVDDRGPAIESVSPNTVHTLISSSSPSSSQTCVRPSTELAAPACSPEDCTSPTTTRSTTRSTHDDVTDAHHRQPDQPQSQQQQQQQQKQSHKNTSGWGISSAINFFDFVCQTFDLGTDSDSNSMPAPFGQAGPPSGGPLPATAEWLSACFGSTPSSYASTGDDGVSLPPSPSPPPRYPPIHAARELVRQYCLSVETFTPIVGRVAADADLYELYAFLGSGQPETAPKMVRPVFRAQMMLAIALRVMVDGRLEGSVNDLSRKDLGRRASQYALASDAIFVAAAAQLRRALERPHHHCQGGGGGAEGSGDGRYQQRRSFSSSAASSDELEMEETLEKLQIVLLLAVYLILCPSRGNVWQILGFADRLWRSIARSRSGAESYSCDDSNSSGPWSEAGRHYQMLQKSFTILERLVGTSLGRPVDPLNDCGQGKETGRREAAGTLSSMLARILGIRARIHAAYQSAKPPRGDGSWSAAARIDSEALNVQIDAWREQHGEAVQAVTVGSLLGDGGRRVAGNGEGVSSDGAAMRAWLHEYGHALAGETKLLALSLHWQETGYYDDGEDEEGGEGDGPSKLSLDEASLQEGVVLVRSLAAHYTRLYNPTRQMVRTDRGGTVLGVSPMATPGTASSTTTTTMTAPTCPFTWLQAVEVFRVAVVAAFLDRVLAEPHLQGEIEALVQVLDKGRLCDSSSLVSALRFITPS